MNTSISRAGLPALGVIVIGLLTGCSGVSDLTKERVGRSETAVQQAQQTVGNSESGAVELQRARDNLDQARRALKANNDKSAERFAQQAQLDAELAVAKAQSGHARKAADEVLASLQQLREESGRTSTDSDR